MSSNGDPIFNEEINKVKTQLDKLTYKEDIYWQQRSRNNWLKAGDLNTSYFHKSTSERKKCNIIFSLKNDQGITSSSQKDIEHTVINYYDNLFTTNHPSYSYIQKITSLVEHKIDSKTNSFLLSLFTKEEVKKDLFDLNPSKAPGPDDFTTLFFPKGLGYNM